MNATTIGLFEVIVTLVGVIVIPGIGWVMKAVSELRIKTAKLEQWKETQNSRLGKLETKVDELRREGNNHTQRILDAVRELKK